MTRFNVNLKSILGDYYYKYELTSDNYNPSVEDDIVLSCKCTNAIGNPIENKDLELYDNGVLVDSATTDSNGIAYWIIIFDDWDNHHFVVGNASLDLEATGYMLMANTSYSGSYYIIRNKTSATLILNGWSCQSCNTSDWVKFGGDNYASQCAPHGFAMGLANNNNVVFRVSSTGEIKYRALKVNQSSTELYMSMSWNIRNSNL